MLVAVDDSGEREGELKGMFVCLQADDVELEITKAAA